MSNTITITNTFSVDGGVLETGAGTPYIEYVDPNDLVTPGTTTSNIVFVIENPIDPGTSGGGGSPGGGNSGGGSGGNSGGGSGGDNGGGNGNGGNTGGGGGSAPYNPPAPSTAPPSSGNSPATTCAAGDPGNGNNPPGPYVAVTGPGAEQIASDAFELAGDIAKLAANIAGDLIGEAIGDAVAENAAAAAKAAGTDAGELTEVAGQVFEGAQIVLKAATGEFEIAEAASLAVEVGIGILGAEGAVLGGLLIAAAALGVYAYVGEVEEQVDQVNDVLDAGEKLITDLEQEAAAKNGSSGNNHSSGGNKGGASDCAGRHDPIVVDLSGNGLNITDLSTSNTYFDFNGNGFSVNTAWIGAGTGFLVIKSTNPAYGVNIGDGYELLGTGAATGFDILKSLITNSAGTISASDSIYSELAIWQDTNADGLAQTSEISSLSALGIASMSLNASTSNESFGLSTVSDLSSVTFTNGEVTQVGEVNLASYNAYSDYTGTYTLTSQILALPDVKGYGLLPD